MLGLWLDRMNGVFQFHRSCSPVFTAAARTNPRSPVRKFRRPIAPPWLSKYTRSGSLASTRHTNPSPPFTNVQSSFVGPLPRNVWLGPPQLPLSCSPPYTRYGLRLSTATW